MADVPWDSPPPREGQELPAPRRRGVGVSGCTQEGAGGLHGDTSTLPTHIDSEPATRQAWLVALGNQASLGRGS